mmetsp:Transcript_4388/g.9481  ORF Transcript_4388/g.9481 Transcript_4388/m.9481 type:complete len:232 (-) Transcript_4388:25-720(-)
MITFLPTPDFAESAAMLDSKRLGNQRVEARMILRWLRDPKTYSRQQNAGYTIMWRGYENALCLYYNACCEEWSRRGGQNIVCQPEWVGAKTKMPPWLGDDELHRTHRSALLYKLPDYYAQYGWASEISEPKVEYLWPRPVEGGSENEYELCPPAYWKKKNPAAAKQARAKREKKYAKAKANPERRTKPKEASKERRKRGSKTPVVKKSSVVRRGRDLLSRYPRRSPRFANR